MVRVAIVAVVAVALVVARVLHDRRRAGLADRTAFDHPPLPERLRGPGRTWIVFATRYCATCGPVVERLSAQFPGDTVRKVLVEDHADVAATYAVRTAPTLLEVDADGRVSSSVAGADAVLARLSALGASGGADLPA